MTALVLAPDEKDARKVATAINQRAQGRSNAVGSVTLAANAATTVVTAKNCGAGSVVLLSALTAHAADNVFSHDDDGRIARHFLIESFVERLAHADLACHGSVLPLIWLVSRLHRRRS